MDTPPRRTVLTTAAVALAGCVDPGGDEQVATAAGAPSTTASGFEDVEPLGFIAVPDGVADQPQLDREQTYETDHDLGFADVVDRSDGLAALAYAVAEFGYDSPRLRTPTRTAGRYPRGHCSHCPRTRRTSSNGPEP